MTLLMAVAIMIAYVGMVRVTSHHAQSAADLSALAAARFAIEGEGRACAMAASLATENMAVLEQCRVGDSVAEVRVAIPLDLPGSVPVTVRARARAGPMSHADLDL